MGGGGSKTSTSSASENKTEAQKQNLATALDLYGPSMGQNENVWQGERVAPLTGLQQSAISGGGNYLDTFSTPQQAGIPMFGETGGAIGGLLSGDLGAQKMTGTDVSDYFTSAIYDPTIKNLNEELIPGVKEAYAGPGFFGSARSQAVTDVSQDTASDLSKQWAELNWNVLQNNQAIDESSANRTLSALPSAMNYGGMPTQNIQDNLAIAAQQISGLGDLLGLGTAEQTQEQAQLQAEIIKFAEENQITDPDNLAIMLSLLGLNFSTSSSKGSGSSWNFGI